jgi:hypothetical protein
MPPGRHIWSHGAAIAAVAIVLAGCFPASRVHYISEQRYRPNGSANNVRLYVNTVAEPHVRIAHVNSFAAQKDDEETRRRQLEDLRKRAWSLGADAVVEVKRLRNKGQGWVIDEQVPFTAYQQGRYRQYFLRGVAIRYGEAPRSGDGATTTTMAATSEPSAVDTRGIPVQPTRDTESPYEAPPVTGTP